MAMVLVGAVLTLVVGAVPAAAHNVLTFTSPAAGTQVGPTPPRVVLTFDEPVLGMGTQILVTGPAGPVQVTSPRLVDNTVVQDLPGGSPAGTFTVAWRVTSADGHPITGTFSFTSTQKGAGTPAPAPSATEEPGPARGGTSSPAVLVGLAVAGALVVAGVVAVRVRRRGDGPNTL